MKLQAWRPASLLKWGSGTSIFFLISRNFLKTFFTENTWWLYLLILLLVVFIAIVNTTCFSSPFDKGILKNFLHHPLFVPVQAYFTSRSTKTGTGGKPCGLKMLRERAYGRLFRREATPKEIMSRTWDFSKYSNF